MKKLLLPLLILFFNRSLAQTPVSHLPQVTFTESGHYSDADASKLTDYSLCQTWNSGNWGGWATIDLHQQISLSKITWWVNMTPNGNVTTELIEVSSNGTDWTVAANTSGYHEHHQERFVDFPTPIPNIRYIRFSQSGTPSWTSVSEMVVNDPYYIHNTYVGMQPKILNAAGQPISNSVNQFPATLWCSKANSYQWKKNGVAISGATAQSYLATEVGNYTCDVTYANDCYIYSPTSTSSEVSLQYTPSDYEIFNGSSDYIGIGNMGATPQQGAISFWVNPSTLGSYPNILSTGGMYNGDPTGNNVIRFEQSGGSIYAVIGNAASTGTSGFNIFTFLNNAAVNQWYHITLNWNQVTNMVTGYLNGVQVFNSPNSYWPAGFNDVRLGMGFNDIRHWNGAMDDVAFYNQQLSAAEVAALASGNVNTANPNLMAYYNFNEVDVDGAGVNIVNNSQSHAGQFNGTTFGTNCTPQNTGSTLNCNTQLWLRADAGVYGSGMSSISDGQKVAQWNDQSSNAYNTTQSNITQQPVFSQNGMNGKPALVFDGATANQYLHNITANPVATGLARTVFVVSKNKCGAPYVGENYPTNGGALLTFKRSARIFCVQSGMVPGLGLYVFTDGGTGASNVRVPEQNYEAMLAPNVSTFISGGEGTYLQYRLNGNQLTTNQPWPTTPDDGAAGFTVGSREDYPSGYYQGMISEIIVFNSELDAASIETVENYLKQKYFVSQSIPFNALPASSQASDNLLEESSWKHSYNAASPNRVIASVKENCQDLGTRNDAVYVEPSAVTINGHKAMRRHYVINSTANPAGIKTVRLYYTNSDFAELQTHYTGLTDASQLRILKYDGPNEDGIYNEAGGTVTTIPAASITAGTAFGQNYLQFDVDDFSEFWIIAEPDVLLPLQLLSFTAKRSGANAIINWSTANEVNVNRFEVERSLDGASFEKINSVAAKNLASASYGLADNELMQQNSNAVFYQLKQIDNDGKFAYSQTVRIELDGIVKVSVSPNPARDNIRITGSSAFQTIGIYDALGRRVKQLKPNTAERYTISELSRGIYTIKLSSNTGTTSLKLMVE